MNAEIKTKVKELGNSVAIGIPLNDSAWAFHNEPTVSCRICDTTRQSNKDEWYLRDLQKYVPKSLLSSNEIFHLISF